MAKEAWDMVRQAEVESQQHLDTARSEIAAEDSLAAQEIGRLQKEMEQKLQAWQEERRAFAEASLQRQMQEMDLDLKRQMQELAQKQQARAQGIIDEFIRIVEQNDGRL